MVKSALEAPAEDPTPIFELFRGSFATELLTAAVAHLEVFQRLAEPIPFDEFGARLELAPRAATVLLTVLRAMKLIDRNDAGQLRLSPLAHEHLLRDQPFFVGDYLGLAAQLPGVLEMVDRLRSDRPRDADREQGAAFIYREGISSAMEQETSARWLTLALAGRAMNVAPHLARQVNLSDSRCVLDVGGGTGIYSIALLQKNPDLQAIVWDRPEVLKVATEMAAEYGVGDRLRCVAGDMFADPVPEGADIALVSNILHDWDVPECRQIVRRLAEALPAGGRMLIHDVFLDDDLSGPLPIALYSAALFTLTEGRAYSAAEYRGWLEEAGLKPEPIQPTLIHCGVLPAKKASA